MLTVVFDVFKLKTVSPYRMIIPLGESGLLHLKVTLVLVVVEVKLVGVVGTIK